MPDADYAGYEASLGPSWLQNPYGQAWLRAMGSVKSFLVNRRLKDGIKQRMPLKAVRDALGSLGVERQINRGQNETDASYALRVQGAWISWLAGGTSLGVLTQLLDAGYTPGGNAVWIEQAIGAETTLDANGNWSNPNGAFGWTFSSSSGLYPPSIAAVVFWSKFLVLVTVYPAVWGGVPPADTSDDANRFRAIISQWKAAQATCDTIVLLTSGYLFDYPRRTFAAMTNTFAFYAGTSTQWTPPSG